METRPQVVWNGTLDREADSSLLTQWPERPRCPICGGHSVRWACGYCKRKWFPPKRLRMRIGKVKEQIAMSETRSHPYPLRPEVQDQLAAALKFRMERCGTCGGPEIFSKREPTKSRCLRCGTRRELAIEKPAVSFRRCQFCREQTMTGRPIAAKLCLACSRLSAKQRQRRLRLRQEAEVDAKTPIKIGRSDSRIAGPIPKWPLGSSAADPRPPVT
jgi:hypothetical protein